jgi:hypothetical protein
VKGKIERYGKSEVRRHNCSPPFLWFRPALTHGSVWVCDCGDSWVVYDYDGRTWKRVIKGGLYEGVADGL